MPDVDPSAGPTELADLLARAGRGEDAAWRGLIELYGRRVYAMAKSRCRREDLAEEIAQAVFATVAAKLGKGGYAEQGKFEAWLFRITMNRVRDEMRRRARRGEVFDAGPLEHVAGPDDQPVEKDGGELAALRAAMGTLSEPDREVVELRHHGGMSFKQIAEALSEPMGTILARHHRALKKLKEIVERSAEGLAGEPGRASQKGAS